MNILLLLYLLLHWHSLWNVAGSFTRFLQSVTVMSVLGLGFGLGLNLMTLVLVNNIGLCARRPCAARNWVVGDLPQSSEVFDEMNILTHLILGRRSWRNHDAHTRTQPVHARRHSILCVRGVSNWNTPPGQNGISPQEHDRVRLLYIN